MVSVLLLVLYELCVGFNVAVVGSNDFVGVIIVVDFDAIISVNTVMDGDVVDELVNDGISVRALVGLVEVFLMLQ